MPHALELHFTESCLQRCPGGCPLGWADQKVIQPADRDRVLALTHTIRSRFPSIGDMLMHDSCRSMWWDFSFSGDAFSGLENLHLGVRPEESLADTYPTVQNALTQTGISTVGLGGNFDTFDARELITRAQQVIGMLLDLSVSNPKLERVIFSHAANNIPDIGLAQETVGWLHGECLEEVIGDNRCVSDSVLSERFFSPTGLQRSAFCSKTALYKNSVWRDIHVEMLFLFLNNKHGFGALREKADYVWDMANISITPTSVYPMHSSATMWQHKKTHEQCLSTLSSLPWSATFPDFVRALL